MSLYADRVKETSTTIGTGTFSLAGAVSRFRTFVAGIGTGNQACYTIEHATLDEWEVGIGTVTDATPDTLSRTTIISSSNANAAVNFTAGDKTVFCTLPSVRIVDISTLGALVPPASPSVENEEFISAADGFSWVDQGTSTVVYQDGQMVFTKPWAGGFSGSLRVKSIVGSDWRYRARLHLPIPTDNSTHFATLALRESATGKISCIGYTRRSAAISVTVARWSNPATFTSYTINRDLNNWNVLWSPIFVEIEKSGSNLIYRYAVAFGGFWLDFVTEAVTSPFTTAPDQVGFMVNNNYSIASTVGVFHFFRKMA